MTAINIIVQAEAVHFITDGAVYSADGTLAAITSKVLPWPHMIAAIAMRGPVLALACYGSHLGMQFSTFDDLVVGIEEAAPLLVEKYSPLWCDSYPSNRSEIYVAGWSDERRQFEAYYLVTEAIDRELMIKQGMLFEGSLLAEPFKLHRLQADSWAPGFDIEEFNRSGIKATSIERIDPEIDGRRVLEVQRQLRANLLEGLPPCHHVGGFAQRTTITSSGIEQTVFHRWPDELGSPILPGPIDYEHLQSLNRKVDVTGLSRLQRERMLKKQAKGTLRP